jgi:hypothetical protein
MRKKLAILLCMLSFAVGVGACWLYVQHHVLRFPPFDRSLYDKMKIDFGSLPLLTIRDDGTNRSHWVGSYRSEREVDASRFYWMLSQFASLGSNETFCIAVGPRMTIDEAEKLITRAREDGAGGARLLIESDPPQSDDIGLPVLKELRIGPGRGLAWYQYEWYLESERLRMANEALQAIGSTGPQPQR